MLVLNALTLFYYDLSCSTQEKPSGVIENWTKGVINRTAPKGSRKGGGSVSLTLVSLSSKNMVKKEPAPLRMITTSDEEWLNDKDPHDNTAVSPNLSLMASRKLTLSRAKKCCHQVQRRGNFRCQT